MPPKADVLAKVDELRDVANGLPSGPGKMALHSMIGKLTGLADAVLNDDGTTHPLATTFVPARGLAPLGGGDGDGHAVTCC
jgi:hypothetical protein